MQHVPLHGTFATHIEGHVAETGPFSIRFATQLDMETLSLTCMGVHGTPAGGGSTGIMATRVSWQKYHSWCMQPGSCQHVSERP